MTLVVADGKGDEVVGAVRVSDVGAPGGRIGRMLLTTRRVLRRALELDADVYHLHDPELIPIGLRLKRLGKAVVFDAHEDLPLQLLSKPYLTPAIRGLVARTVGAYQRYACARFDGVVTAMWIVTAKFIDVNPNTVDVNNFPLPGEFAPDVPWSARRPQACYVGSVSAMRGIGELVQAAHLLKSPARITVAGSFSEPEHEAALRALPGWARLDRPGHLDRAGVAAVMEQAMVGLLTLHPQPNYCESLPVKLFEYMAAGIPVISSDVPLWRGIVQSSQCGVCVDPFDPAAIAAAIDYFVLNPQIAQRMGQNGRRAILEQYNWQTEAGKLLRFYQDLEARLATKGKRAAAARG